MFLIRKTGIIEILKVIGIHKFFLLENIQFTFSLNIIFIF